MSIDLDFFGRHEEVARPIAHSLSTNRRGGDCWGWPRLVNERIAFAIVHVDVRYPCGIVVVALLDIILVIVYLA